jgi:hypothetical protein
MAAVSDRKWHQQHQHQCQLNISGVAKYQYQWRNNEMAASA